MPIGFRGFQKGHVPIRRNFKVGYNKHGVYVGFQKGDLNPSCSPERRKEISEWRKSHPTSWITRRRQSRSMKLALKNPEIRAKWIKNGLGRKLSLETINKIRETKKIKYPTPIKGLILKLDGLFSKYKRLSNLTDQGYIRCFTCNGFFSYREIDCGHFVSRKYMNTRYMEENTEPQCRKCNRFGEGAKDVFAINLQKKYGEDILQKLNDKRNEIKQFYSAELEELIVIYKAKVKELEIKKLGRVGNK